MILYQDIPFHSRVSAIWHILVPLSYDTKNRLFVGVVIYLVLSWDDGSHHHLFAIRIVDVLAGVACYWIRLPSSRVKDDLMLRLRRLEHLTSLLGIFAVRIVLVSRITRLLEVRNTMGI